MALLRRVRAAGSAALILWVTTPSNAQPIPAGETAAVLSFIDAAAERVEVVRHWPGAPVDVDVYPFVPYFWKGCPGSGAIMMLVTGPGGSFSIVNRIVSILDKIGSDLSGLRGIVEIVRIAAGLRTPGDQAQEALKAAMPWISDLGAYERRGYAVLLFIHWNGLRCVVTLRAVAEGYAIPFVQ